MASAENMRPSYFSSASILCPNRDSACARKPFGTITFFKNVSIGFPQKVLVIVSLLTETPRIGSHSMLEAEIVGLILATLLLPKFPFLVLAAKFPPSP
jgi:hypothetical protein